MVVAIAIQAVFAESGIIFTLELAFIPMDR